MVRILTACAYALFVAFAVTSDATENPSPTNSTVGTTNAAPTCEESVVAAAGEPIPVGYGDPKPVTCYYCVGMWKREKGDCVKWRKNGTCAKWQYVRCCTQVGSRTKDTCEAGESYHSIRSCIQK